MLFQWFITLHIVIVNHINVQIQYAQVKYLQTTAIYMIRYYQANIICNPVWNLLSPNWIYFNLIVKSAYQKKCQSLTYPIVINYCEKNLQNFTQSLNNFEMCKINQEIQKVTSNLTKYWTHSIKQVRQIWFYYCKDLK